jgi:spore coat protein U-like protein
MRQKISAIALFLFAFSANSFAQSEASASTTATLVAPIAIDKVFDMNFGQLASSGTPGEVALNFADGVSRIGGVKLLSAAAVKSAEFLVSGEGNLAFTISYPTTLILSSGQDQLTVSAITCQQGFSSILQDGARVLKFGAVLEVPANTPSGIYGNASDLTVTVNYN